MAANEEEDFDPPPSPATFVIRDKLSHGSYGVVFQGELNKKPVAVKKIHSTLLNEEGSERLLKAFKNECRYLKSLDHPNVVKFMGAYRDKEGPLLVMELMKESLEEFLKKNRGDLSFRRQLDICNSISKGLVFLHDREKPIIHRDLNDKNVLLAEDGTVKIADFGQSKLIDKPGKFLMSTQQPGAVAYMPPEALDDNPHYTPSVDTFSLGVLMLEIATQQPPQVGLTKIGSKPEVLRRAANLRVLGDDHLLKPLIIWCLQECDCRPSVASVHNQTSTLRALEEKVGLADVSVIEQLKKRLTEEIKSKEELEEEIITYTQIIEQYRSDFEAERKDREAAAGKFADREKEWMEQIRRTEEERDHLKALNTQLQDRWIKQIGRARAYSGHLDPTGKLQEEVARRQRDEGDMERLHKRNKELQRDLQKKKSEIQQLQEEKGRIEKDFERQVQKYGIEKEAWFLLVDKLKGKLEEQMQETKNPEGEKSELHVKCERLEEEKREAVTEANRLQQELTGIRESHKMEKEDMLKNHQEELQLLKNELLEKHQEAIAIEIAKRSDLEKEVKQLQQEKEQLKLSRKPITQAPVPRARSNTNRVASQLSRKPITQAPVPRARSNTNRVASQVPQGHEPTSQDWTDMSSTVPRRSKPSPLGPKPGYMDDLEKKFKRHTIAEGVNISGYSSPVASVEQVMGQTKATSPPPVKPKPKKGT